MNVLLTDTQRVLLKQLLDHIIPKEGEMPAAGEIAARHVEGAAEMSSVTARVVLDMMVVADAMAGSCYGKPFSDIADSSKEPLLKIIQEQYPRMFGEFVTLAYNGYYTDESVVRLLGPDAGIPQPKGFLVASFNPAIVSNVRKLGQRYRATRGPD